MASRLSLDTPEVWICELDETHISINIVVGAIPGFCQHWVYQGGNRVYCGGARHTAPPEIEAAYRLGGIDAVKAIIDGAYVRAAFG